MNLARSKLQKLRDDGWDSLLKKVYSFCEKNDLSKLNMEEDSVNPKKPRERTNVTYLHHYVVDCFYVVVDMLLQEFNDHFDAVNSDLLSCMASLSPRHSFRDFDPVKLKRMAEFIEKDL